MKFMSSWRRWIILVIFLLFIIVGTFFWIINGNGPLATVISILFVSTGLVFSFFQAFPSSRPDADSPKKSDALPVPPANSPKLSAGTRYDWGDAPHVRQFYGRARELAQVERWIDQERCRVVLVLGMGGIGKTTLAAKVTEAVGPQFEALCWRSLQNTPPVEDMLAQWLQFLLEQQSPPQSFDAQLSTLLNHLREHRCLLVLDNVESIFQEGGRAGQYREGYEGYGRLFRALGNVQHQSCLLLTSREKPAEVVRLEGSFVRSLLMPGVDLAEGRQMLAGSAISGSDEGWQRLIARYTGNPLALKLAAETVRDMYGGNIDRFLQEGETVFGDINDLLEQQFLRLTLLEQELLYWLAIEREPTTLVELQELLVHHIQKGRLLESLLSLRRRCMLETNEAGDDTAFTLLPVIVDYVTNRLVSLVYEELVAPPAVTNYTLFASHALMLAQTRDYIRNSQVRYIVRPLAERLLHLLGKDHTQELLKRLLVHIREKPTLASSYAAGNVLNVLLQTYPSLNDYDFSRLTLRQAYLQDATLHNLNFSKSHFARAVFTENFGGILSLAFHPHAPLLALGTASGEVKLVDVRKGISLFSGLGHTDAVWSVAFSPDGRLLASGSQDHSIRLWDTNSGECLETLSVQSARISSLAFSPDGHTLASGGGDSFVRLWQIAPGGASNRSSRPLTQHAKRVLAVAFSPDGRLLASGGEDMDIYVMELESGKCLNVLHGSTGRICSLVFHPNGRLLASAGEDQLVRLWDVQSGTPVAELSSHTDIVRTLAFNRSSEQLWSGGDDQNICIWNVAAKTCLHVLRHHTDRIWSIALSHDGALAASGSEDQTVRVWELQSQRILYTLQGRTAWVWSLAFNATGDQLASSDYTVRLWDMKTQQNTHTLQRHLNRVRTVAFHPTRPLLATGSEDRTIRLWNSASRECLHTLQGHTDWLRSVAFHPDGELLASGSDDKTVRLWNLQDGQLLRVMTGHTGEVRSIAFHPNGKLLASGAADATIRVWEVASGKTLAKLEGHTGRVRPVAFNRTGLLASGAGDRTVRLWNSETGECLAILVGHAHEIRALAFHPEGELLASSGEDHTIHLWNVDTHSALAILSGHTSRIRALAFHPGGQILASGSDDGTIRLWRIPEGQCLSILRSDKPYEGTNITGATGLTQGQRTALRLLGAIDI